MKKRLILVLVVAAYIFFIAKSTDTMIRYNMDWLEYIKYSVGLNYGEEAYLENNNLICGVYVNEIPLSFVDEETKQNSGMVIDYISQMSIELEDEIGVAPMEADQLEVALQSGDIDIATIEKNKETVKKFNFTEPLYTLHGKILVKNASQISKIDELKNFKLATVDSGDIVNATKKYFSKEQNVSIIVVKDLYSGIDLLKDGLVDGVAGDETKISYALNQSKGYSDYKFLEYALYRKEVCLAVKKDNNNILSITNKAILKMKQKNLIMQTQSKWFGTFTPSVKDMKSYDYIYGFILFSLSIVVLLITWNFLTSRKVNEKTHELYESKEELRVIIDTLNRGIIVIDENKKIVECNNAVLRILELSRKNLLNKDYLEINELKPYIDLNEENRHFSYGNSYYFVTNTKIDEDEKTLITIEDYTDKYINEKTARQESKMIAVGQLSAGLAHEIRNPLGLIKSYVYVIKNYCLDDVGGHAISVIEDSISRINSLIENLLRFSKLSNEESKLININSLIESIIRLEEKNIGGNDIVVNINAAKDIEIKMNEDVIKLLLFNLLNNGIESLNEIKRDKKTIDIHISISDSNLLIEFTDNGCGIGGHDLENIFNPFYTTKENGTGLGLYIISTEIEKIDGKIRAESKLGEGTTFHILLPIEGADNE
ncbi:MAG: transporter substrate-binding domain-containing protein [Clostridiales bacterium]|nr:transporter substrate-binding domain-containing protein [Clostridiales bacterium]